ncbi:rhodanese-like domain-containing protein [Oceanisphaera avium]|uniref:Rhodanese-like domain-containing protein n=1 Tax=Oceanisphaera avium TaxID=1903694 RepID=A0A1Y0D0F7_9GAMM|nr:rhodanese-like domain-containing protein [Oceanisphaera avium]ART80586.1 rhodanese-like domain-containing protein [Oceanisphaera avium]
MQEYLDFFANNTLLVVAWIGLVAAIIVMTVMTKFSKVHNIPTQEAVLLINKQDAVVVDVRNADEFRKGHISGAINVPASQLKANDLSQIQKYQQKPIILVCETGMTTTSIGRVLTKADYAQVYALRGGMSDWRTQNLPVTKR